MTPEVPFQSLLDGLPYGVFIKDAGSRILCVSPACAETWGLKASDIVGTRGEGFFPADQLESFWAVDRQIMTGGKPVSQQEVFWSERYQSNRIGFTTKSPVCDAQGTPQYLICTTLDITEDVQSHERAKLLETVMMAASVGVVITGPDRRVLSSNPAFSSITGYRQEEVLGRTLAFLQGNDAQVLARLSAALEAAVPFEGVLRNYGKDGSAYWNELSIAPVLAADGTLTHFVGVNRDITEGREARHMLENRERQYRELVEKMHLGLVVHEPDGRIKLVNPRALDMLGLTEAQMLGTTPMHAQWQLSTTDGAPYPPDQIPSTLAAATGKPVRNAILGVYRPLRQDTVWLQINADPELDSEGQLVQVAVTLADITEMRETQNNLRTTREQAEQLAGHLQAVLDNMGDGVITIDPQGCILSFNAATSAIFGYTAQEMVGQPVHRLMPQPHKDLHGSYMAHYADTGEQRIMGAPRDLQGQRKNGEVFPMNLRVSQTDRAGGRVFVGIVRDITQRLRDEDEIRRLAFYDPLTGLPNRRLLMDRVKHVMASSARSGQHAALMFLDLDHFKDLNDTLGHEVGDELLRQVASRILACVREDDSVARLGGDEFVILLDALSPEPLEAASQTEQVAAKIVATLNAPYQLHGQPYSCTPSVGIVVFMQNRETMDELLKKADIAMYQAKSAGRNTVRFYDPDMQAAAAARAALERDIRGGLALDEFMLYYQPQVDQQGQTFGAEALLRWKHPVRGMVSPAEFIPLAEETRLILPLGQWVLEAACAQLVAWASNPHAAHWKLSVNVSALQIAQPDFVEKVLQVVQRTGAPADRLKLEITESLLAHDIETVVHKMAALKAAGIGFSLDDFGTGFSSLSYLRRLPLDQLKIDQSFVRDLESNANDAVIARTIIALGHSLGLQIIAEGVETTAQRNILLGFGCDAFQGYLFGRPAPQLNPA